VKQKRRIKTILTILVVLLIINIFSVTKVCLYNVLANNNTTTASNTNSTNSKTKETSIELFSGKASDNIPYDVDNMYPGDGLNDNSYTNYYNIKVNYHSNVTVHFKANIKDGYDVLAEVLKVEVKINNESKYDGLMKDMPSSITYDLSSNSSTSTTINYVINVYLDTSVGNKYQNKELKADFKWWIPETENLDSSDNILWKVVDTGVGIDYIANNTSTYLIISIIFALINISGIIYIFLKSKEDYR
jgi:hypothetical protein